jgi:SAM-dependent methyltransferase
VPALSNRRLKPTRAAVGPSEAIGSSKPIPGRMACQAAMPSRRLENANETNSMGRLLNIVTPLHKATKRDYLARMVDDKVHCMMKAKEYEFDYWDGDRRYGYGGYKFIEGRWKPVAQALIDIYGLTNESKILDVGCGKAFLLYEIKKLLPGIQLAGFDISKHGLESAKDEIKPYLYRYRAQDRYAYGDKHFDLVISLGTFHNLRLFELHTALQEVERVGKNTYVMVEGYRNELEQFNLECWALTAEQILHTSEWIWLYEHFGYTGDYEFIYFE